MKVDTTRLQKIRELDQIRTRRDARLEPVDQPPVRSVSTEGAQGMISQMLNLPFEAIRVLHSSREHEVCCNMSQASYRECIKLCFLPWVVLTRTIQFLNGCQ